MAPGCRHHEQDQAAAFVERWQLLYNSHDLAGFTALYAEEGNFAVPGIAYFARNPNELRDMLEVLWRASPALRVTAKMDFIVAGGNRIALFFELSGTGAQGGQQSIGGATFLQMENGRIRSQLTSTWVPVRL